MLRILIAALPVLLASQFEWEMRQLKTEVTNFYNTRRHVLADPYRTAMEHCAAYGQSVSDAPLCKSTIEIRDQSLWVDVCEHQEPSTFRPERFYRLRLQCRRMITGKNSIAYPPLSTLVKR